MVGNLLEWVAEWVPRSTTCSLWSAGIGLTSDQRLADATTTGEPGALQRGGDFARTSGPLSVYGIVGPSRWFVSIGFRCVR